MDRKSTHLPAGNAHQPAISQLLRMNPAGMSELLVQVLEMIDLHERLGVRHYGLNDKRSFSIRALHLQLQQWLKI